MDITGECYRTPSLQMTTGWPWGGSEVGMLTIFERVMCKFKNLTPLLLSRSGWGGALIVSFIILMSPLRNGSFMKGVLPICLVALLKQTRSIDVQRIQKWMFNDMPMSSWPCCNGVGNTAARPYMER